MTRDDLHKDRTKYLCRNCNEEVDRRTVSKGAAKAKRCEECYQYLNQAEG